MDNFLSTLIFTLPGLLCYFWISWFGLSPSQKHNPFEMIGISALLWIPVSFMTILAYNCIALLTYVKWPVLPFLSSLEDLSLQLNNFLFLVFFIVGSMVFSYLFARMWASSLHEKVMTHVNKIRVKIGFSPFSRTSTVWEEVFVNHGAKVLEISKIDKKQDKIIGCMRKASRPLEPERNLVLDDVDYFTKLVEKYNPAVDHVFIETKAGLMIKVFNPKDIKEAQEKDLESDNPIS